MLNVHFVGLRQFWWCRMIKSFLQIICMVIDTGEFNDFVINIRLNYHVDQPDKQLIKFL